MSVTVESKSEYSFLYRVLRLDGMFAAVSGVAVLVGSKAIGSLFNLDSPAAILAVGAIVLGYGLALLIFARRDDDNRVIGLGAIVLNSLWVAVSYLGLLLGWWDVNTAGKWTIALIAEVVFIFAILQIIGMRRINKRADLGALKTEEDYPLT